MFYLYITYIASIDVTCCVCKESWCMVTSARRGEEKGRDGRRGLYFGHRRSILVTRFGR
jgi:hypothetical protein